MTLLPWPEKLTNTREMDAIHFESLAYLYEFRRAEAALQRLRVAEGLLVQCYTYFAHLQKHTEASKLLHDKIHEALDQIGEVPPA
jgi:hypothetical protein